MYKIPVVFHVLHNGGVENISDEQIYDCLDLLNRDYRLLNQDANNVHAEFQGMPADIEVEFKLATIAPNGQCFSGITHTFSPMSYQGDDGDAQVDAIIAGNNVYNGTWAGNKYLNIFVCGDIGGAAGYTYKPSTWGATSMKNGIWILHDYVGAIGTGGVGTSRALTHEVGHWLNLRHIWGDATCGSDLVSDTPTHNTANYGCPAAGHKSTCTGTPIEMTMNFMDYTNDVSMYMFTNGQRDRMRAQFLPGGYRNAFL